MNKEFAAVAVALAVQMVAVGWLVWRYERIVSRGAEIRLKCRAYDPYDPLRGRYLQTSVSEECTNILFTVDSDRPWQRETHDIFAKLADAPGSNGLYHVVAIAREPLDKDLWIKPKSVRFDYTLDYDAKRKGESYGDFEKRRKASPRKAIVEFPDRLFMNEKLAPAAEKILAKKTDSAVAVFRALDGEIIITDIEIGGRPILSAAREQMEKPPQRTGK